MKRVGFAAAGVLGLVAVLAAERADVIALRAQSAPSVDGDLSDWPDGLGRLDAAPMSLAVRYDREYVYLSLATSDASTRVLLARAGFRLWWDPAGREKKTFGLTIPAAAAGLPMGRERPARGDDRENPPSERDRERRGPPETGLAVVPLAIEEIGHLEIAGPREDDQRRLEMPYANTLGLAAAAALNEGVLSYEIRIPLVAAEGRPYAIARTTPGRVLGLGLETLEMPRPPRPETGEEGRGRPGGGMGFPGGGRRGGGPGGGSRTGGPEGGPGFSAPKPVKFWAVVRLES
ncbi:MAG: hypothetical protein AB7I50_11365 [Vicinamibacterales bacterium]